MKRILTILFISGLSLLAVSCDKEKYSIAVSSDNLTLESSASSVSVDVTAKDVEWKVEVDAAAKEWLSVEKKDGKVEVAVTENRTMMARSTAVRVIPTTNVDKVKKIDIIVTQKGRTTPLTYEVILSSSSLSFAQASAPMQTVTVTTKGEGLEWTAVLDAKAKDWATMEVVDNKINITVSDNETLVERAGTITINPNNASATKKAIMITQAPKVVEYFFAVNFEGPVNFKFDDLPSFTKTNIPVIADRLEWSVSVEDATLNGETWFKVSKSYGVEGDFVVVMPLAKNNSRESRTGYVIITPDKEDLEPVKISVIQGGQVDYLSDLREDMVIADKMKNNRAVIYPNQTWSDPAVKNSTKWDIRFMGDGMTWSNTAPNVKGQGHRIELQLWSERIVFNDEDIYNLPSGEYVVSNEASVAGTIKAGMKSNNLSFPTGTWFFVMDGGTVVNKATFAEGKITVSSSKDIYTFVFDVKDDRGNKITGTFTGELNISAGGQPTTQDPSVPGPIPPPVDPPTPNFP